MKIALFGFGPMGRLVREQALDAGHEIGAIFSSKDKSKFPHDLSELVRGHDVAIDFSVHMAVLGNVEACVLAGVPLVEGTTGWNDDELLIRRTVKEHNGTLVYGANLSIGVNVFYHIVAHSSALMATLEQYQAFIEEQHHSRKRDAPSGTALKLKSLMTENLKTPISITSTRAGSIPGTHRVGFDSPADQITLTHTARSRAGFAAGALMAAQWIIGRKGVYEFSDVIDEMLSQTDDGRPGTVS